MSSKQGLGCAVVTMVVAAAVAGFVRAESSALNNETPHAVAASNPDDVRSFSQDFKAGHEALKAGRLDVARLHLMKVIMGDPTDTSALELLAQTTIARAVEFASRDEHLAAAKSLQEGRSALVLSQEQLTRSAKSIAGFPVLVVVDHKLSQAESELRMDVERKAFDRVQEAGKLAGEAYHRWGRNDRNKVREAVSKLHYVADRYELIGNWLQAELHRELARQKGLLADKEWDEMLASAGFTRREGHN